MRKLSYLTDNLVPRSPRSCAGLRKWRLRDGPTRRAQEGPLKLPDERQSLKRKENWRKLLLLGIQTGDKLAKPPFFVAYSRLCRRCHNLVEGGRRLSRFHFRLCRYFLGHVTCQNLPWQGLFSLSRLQVDAVALCQLVPRIEYFSSDWRPPRPRPEYLKARRYYRNIMQKLPFAELFETDR